MSPSTKEGFTGHEKDGATGLVYAGARYYLPAVPRWTSVDPMLQKKAPVSLLTVHEGKLLWMSPYNYVFGNPTNLNDPDGECPPPCSTVIGGIIGAAGGAVTSGGIELGSQLLTQYRETGGINLGGVDWGAVNDRGVEGLVEGAVTGAAIGTFGPAGGIAVGAGGGAVGRVAAKANTRAQSGESTTITDIVKDAAIGAGNGAVAVMSAGVADDVIRVATGSAASKTFTGTLVRGSATETVASPAAASFSNAADAIDQAINGFHNSDSTGQAPTMQLEEE